MKRLQSPENVLFYDIETAPLVENCMELPKGLRHAWISKMRHETESIEEAAEVYFEKAGLYAEFARVVAISVGHFSTTGEFRVIGKCLEDEKELLKWFGNILTNSKDVLGGHNILNFDNPFLCKRYMINEMKVPGKIDHTGAKPWDIIDNSVDTMKVWQFGAPYSGNASLDAIAGCLRIESPKTDMDGSEVGKAFYGAKLDEINKYCIGDVVCVARVYSRLCGKKTDFEVEYV